MEGEPLKSEVWWCYVRSSGVDTGFKLYCLNSGPIKIKFPLDGVSKSELSQFVPRNGLLVALLF